MIVVFVGPPSSQAAGTPSELFALRLVVGDVNPMNMGFTERSGQSVEVLDSEHPMAGYFLSGLTWTATIERGVLAADPFATPLAVTREGHVVAYEEIVGGGVVLWVPPPVTQQHWEVLVDGATRLWEQRVELAAGSAQERKLQESVAALDTDYRSKRQSIMSELRALRERRLRFDQEDPVVQRVRSRMRAAKSYGPAGALRAYADVLEMIEQQYGGERGAIQVLGYTGAAARKITAPANSRDYYIRHPGSKEPIPVPQEVLEAAAQVADDIVARFVEQRYREWSERNPE